MGAEQAGLGVGEAVAGEEARLLAALGAAERRRLGCYLTPWPVAALMAGRLSPEILAGGDVVDPAVGSGRLLAAVLGLMERDAPGSGLARLHGVELQPALAELANGMLARVAEYTRAGERLEAHEPCRVADALLLLRAEPRRAVLGRGHFHAVIANPPYVREKHHGEVFQRLLGQEPAWAGRFRPRQDLQQLFLGLALDWLLPGGELVFLVNPYWLQSDSGQDLRRRFEARATLLAVVDFGAVQLFPEAKGQHHLLIHARAHGGEAAAVQAPSADCRVVRVAEPGRRPLAQLCAEVERALGGAASGHGLEADWMAVQASGPRRRWHLAPRNDGLAARLERVGVPLGACFRTHQGVVSGADRVTARNCRHLDGPAALGAGIFVLSASEASALTAGEAERGALRRVYRARDIRPAWVGPAEQVLIYAQRGFDLAAHPALAAHLEAFRPLLSRRRECQTGAIPWYELHWPRDPALFRRPRLVTPRRATEPRFAWAPAGTCEQSDIALITDPDDDAERLAALLVALHSPPVRAWCRQRGKQKGQVREFFGHWLEEIPLPPALTDDPPAFRSLAAWASPDRLEDGGRRASALYGWPPA